jgi:hypothetical protein
MQQEILKMQEEHEQAEYTAAAGGGRRGQRDGQRQARADRPADRSGPRWDPERRGDAAGHGHRGAVNEALRKAEDSASQNMSRLTGGLNLGYLKVSPQPCGRRQHKNPPH